MDFKQLRSFVTVADYRNFSRAAEKLNIAQSTVSMHLAQLEEELGVKLANRTTKTIEITEIGFKVYKYATQILELTNYIHDSCTGDERNIIRIAASTIPATHILPGVCQQYRQLFPNDYLKISQCGIKDAVEGVLDKRFDVAIVDQEVTKKDLTCIPICSNLLILITAANDQYLMMQQRGASIKEFLQEPFILREDGEDQKIDLVLNAVGMEYDNLRVVARVNDLETVKNMVASGMGISLIPQIAAQDFIKEHRLVSFSLSKCLEENIYLIYPNGYTDKDHAWNFIDYLNAASRHGFLWG